MGEKTDRRGSEANLAEFDDESPLCLEDADEERDDHRVAPEDAPEYLKGRHRMNQAVTWKQGRGGTEETYVAAVEAE
jgi:hypothetical protein